MIKFEDKVEAVRAIQAGEPLEAVAARLHISEVTIRQCCQLAIKGQLKPNRKPPETTLYAKLQGIDLNSLTSGS